LCYVLSDVHINHTLTIEAEVVIETSEQWEKITETARGEVHVDRTRENRGERMIVYQWDKL
jgi:hypothetical protein